MQAAIDVVVKFKARKWCKFHALHAGWYYTADVPVQLHDGV